MRRPLAACRWSPTGRILVGIGAALLALTPVAAQDVPVSPQERQTAKVQGEKRAAMWTKRLQEAETELRAGHGEKAEKIARLLARDMMDNILFGESAGQWLGTACLMRALGVAQQGRAEEAVWHWHVAQHLYPALRATDLGPYGEAGELLMASPIRPAAVVALPRIGAETGAGITPPKEVFAPFAAYPFAKKDLGAEPRISVECRVAEDGRVSHPLVASEETRPTYLLAALDALREWKLEPARRDGEPVAVLHRLVVTFELR